MSSHTLVLHNVSLLFKFARIFLLVSSIWSSFLGEFSLIWRFGNGTKPLCDDSDGCDGGRSDDFATDATASDSVRDGFNLEGVRGGREAR